MRVVLAVALFGCAALARATDDVPPGVFAVVGAETVPMEVYEARVQAALRRTFYHGNAPADRVAATKRDVAQALVDRVLLLQEARRRGLAPDVQQVERGLEGFRERHSQPGAAPVGERGRMEAKVRTSLEEDSLIGQIETQVKDVSAPTMADVRAYYEAHPDKFTTPARWRVSMILLRVEPSSSASVWQAAQDEVQRLQTQLDKGADFAELARIHSSDASGQAGGDLGYLHEGMLAPDAERAIKDTKVGAVTPPVLLLQGVALFRVAAYEPPQHNDYAMAEDRARGLLVRERQEEAGRQLLAALRKATPVIMNADLR